MNKTVSQKIARVFEIAGYLWLGPSIISLFLPFLYSIMFIFTGHPEGIVALAVIAGIFGTGIFLLVKYYQHSRGWLDEDKVLPLWFGTLIFNSLFLLPTIYFYFSSSSRSYSYNTEQSILTLIWYLPPFWWAMAVLLSVAAIVSQFVNQKYR